MSYRSHLLLGAIAVGAASFTSAAYAQEGIEIVTVTAAKRIQNVQDVPISMSVMSQKELEKYNLADLKDIANSVPGLQYNRTNNISTIALRGFGSSPANPAIDQTVAVYIDGIFNGRARQYMLPFFDIARMEVLRGPQGALLGKNTAAGAVNFVTANPTDVFEAAGSVSYLIDRKGVDAYGYVSGPILDDLSGRVAAKFVSKSGWVHNIATNTDVPEVDTKQVRATLRWQPSQNFDMVTKLGYESMDQKGKAISGFAPLTQRPQINLTQNSPGLNGVTDYDRQNSYHFANTATASFDDLTLVSITGVDAYTSAVVTTGEHRAPETITSQYIDDFNQVSQEFRLLSPTGGTFEWIIGVYADYSYQRLDNTGNFQGFAGGLITFNATTFFKQNANSYSAYATGTWHATDQLSLIVGVRGTQTHKSATFTSGPYVGPVGPLGGFPGYAPGRTLMGTLDEASFDPSATLQYKVTDDIMVYAGWSKGSKGGAFQGANRTVAPADFSFRPEVSNNYEVGVKSTLWDWLTVNATAYILKFKNLQSGQYVGSPPVLITKNAAEAESKGVELILNANLDQWVEGLSYSLSGSYIDARYTDYPGDSCTTASALAANGGCVNGNFTVGPNAGTQFNGKGLPFAIPAWNGSMQINYVRPIMDGLKVELNLSADMQSHYWVDAGGYDPLYGYQNGNTKLNFRVAIGDEHDRWTVAVIGRNVNDVITTSGGAILTGGSRVYGIDEDRSISIQGSVKLN